MHHAIQFVPAETISWMWSQLHQGADFALNANDAYYLKTLAIALDDDVSSLLLLKKLKLARIHVPGELPPDAVALNSILEFTFGSSDRQSCQLVHNPRQRDYALSINSRLGIGLVGMRSGQTVLWPHVNDRLEELRVYNVQTPETELMQLAKRERGGASNQ